MGDLIDFKPKEEFFWEGFETDLIQNESDPRMPMRMLFQGSQPIAIIGVNILKKGVGELWMLPSEKIDGFPVEIVKAIKWLINVYIPVIFGIHKLQIAIREGWEQGCKWAKVLGFKFEYNSVAHDHSKQTHHVFYRLLEDV